MIFLGASILAVTVAGTSAAALYSRTFTPTRTVVTTARSFVAGTSLLLSGSAPIVDITRVSVPSRTVARTESQTPANQAAQNTDSDLSANQPGQDVNSGVPKTSLGINIAKPTYYGGERSFMNLTAGSSWVLRSPAVNFGSMPENQLDVNGVVTKLYANENAVRILSLPNAAYKGQSTEIKCIWDGDGKVRMEKWVTSNVVYNPNSLTFTWVPNGKQAAHIRVTYTNPSNPLRKLDCREANASPTDIFHPEFIKSLAPYSSIRFMDWAETNTNNTVTWATRTTPEASIIRGKDGVAIEYMVALANQANVDPWFTIPWNADATYIRNFAIYVRDNLAANRTAYVETSNEVWNSSFPVAHQAKDEGLKAGLSANPFQAQMFRYSEKSAEVLKIWTEVFAKQPNRIVRVVASQNANSWVADQILNFGDTAKYVDALATAPYFGNNVIAKDESSYIPLDTIFDRLPQKIEDSISKAKINQDKAAKLGKRYIAYEAGQHIVTDNVSLNEAIQRDPRMRQMYDIYLNAWKQQIGDHMALYADIGPISKYGAWGAQEYIGQPLAETPKLQSILKFAANN